MLSLERMASATHITLGGDLRYRVSDLDVKAPDGQPVRALHIYDLDTETHYEVHLALSVAESVGSSLAGHGIVIATRLPENGAQATHGAAE